MTYPMVQMPRLREFIEKALGYDGVQAGITSDNAVGPRGPERFRYLRRGDGAPVILPSIGDEERLTPTVLSSLIRQLRLPPSDFGLTLGHLEE